MTRCRQSLQGNLSFATSPSVGGREQDPNGAVLSGGAIREARRISTSDAKSEYGGVLHFGWGNGWAIRDGNWKLIGRENRKSGEVRTTLHNLAGAAPEAKNHAAEQPEIVARLTAMHATWAKDVAPK